MKRVRKLAVLGPVAVLSALLVTGCGTGPDQVAYSADYPAYSSAQEIVGAADVIVKGVAVNARVEELRPDASTDADPRANPQAGLSADEAAQATPVVVTVTTVRVTEAIKGGAAAGSLIEVSQLGGELKGVRYVDADTTLLSNRGNQEYVLILADHGKGVPYDLLNPEQAMYTVSATNTLVAVSGGKPLAVGTVDELKAMAAGR